MGIYFGACCVRHCYNFYKFYENIFYQFFQTECLLISFRKSHIFSYIKIFDGQGTPIPFSLCKGGRFLSKFLDILSMSLSFSLEITDSLHSQGGIGVIVSLFKIQCNR